MSVVPSAKIEHAVLGGIFRADITVMTLEGEWRRDKEDNVRTMSTNDNTSPRFYPTVDEDLPTSIQCLADEIASTRQFNEKFIRGVIMNVDLMMFLDRGESG